MTYPGVATQAQYTYDPSHLYTGGTDSRCNPLPTTTYDTNGLLQSVTAHPDPSTSYTTSYTYDMINPMTVSYPDEKTSTGLKTTTTYPDNSTLTRISDTYGKAVSGHLFRGCRDSVMFRPPVLFIVPTAAHPAAGQPGLYVRAYRASLPSHAPDIQAVRMAGNAY